MSDAVKAKMSLTTYGKSRAEYEGHARKILEATDCPAVMVVASSGAPSTENSVMCSFVVADVPALAGWTPHCNARFVGQVHNCPLVAHIYRRFKSHLEVNDVEALQAINQKLSDLRLLHAGRKLWQRRVSGAVGWYEYVEPELTQPNLRNL